MESHWSQGEFEDTKGVSESVNRTTDNTCTIWPKEQTPIYKTLQRKLKSSNTNPLNTGSELR